MSEQNVIFELNEEESTWWKDLLKKERKRIIKKPRLYVTEYLQKHSLNIENLSLIHI